MTDNVTTSAGKSTNAGFKLSKKKRNRRSKPLLPQVVGIHANSEGQLELATSDGLIDIGGDFWTTEKLIDELFYCLARIEAEPKLVTVPCTNGENPSCKTIDLLGEYESSTTLLYRKYIIRAEKLAGSYLGDKPNIFAINLSDLDERLQAELLDLQRTKSSRETLSLVLHSAVARIFALASLAWFYESALEEIQVILEP